MVSNNPYKGFEAWFNGKFERMLDRYEGSLQTALVRLGDRYDGGPCSWPIERQRSAVEWY